MTEDLLAQPLVPVENPDDAIHEQARRIQQRVDLAFVVGNSASVMGDADTRGLLVDGDDRAVVEGSKDHLGARVADRLASRL
jgi:phosphopantothenoylcysteine decarboxylase/phosphopantothenate--cysteine ligase